MVFQAVAVQKVNEILKKLNISLVKNFNIVKKHLGNRGLHLNKHGISRLAINYSCYNKEIVK